MMVLLSDHSLFKSSIQVAGTQTFKIKRHVAIPTPAQRRNDFGALRDDCFKCVERDFNSCGVVVMTNPKFAKSEGTQCSFGSLHS